MVVMQVAEGHCRDGVDVDPDLVQGLLDRLSLAGDHRQVLDAGIEALVAAPDHE